MQYGDYAEWQRKLVQGDWLAEEVAWWRTRLAGSPSVLDSPLNRARPAVRFSRGASHVVVVPEVAGARVLSVSQRYGATPFMTLLAVFQLLLSRVCGSWSVPVGTAVAGRTHVEVEPLIGPLLNTLVLHTRIDGRATFGELLAKVREVVLDAHAHQDLPFDVLLEHLRPERDLAYSPIFQTLFAMEDVGESGRLRLVPGTRVDGLAKFDLTLTIIQSGAQFAGVFNFRTDVFEAATIERLAAQWLSLLSASVEDSSRSVAELPLVVEGDRDVIRRTWNDEPPPAGGLLERLENTARELSDAIAVVDGEGQITYRTLHRKANALARHLGCSGVGLEDRVALCLPRSADLLVGVLAVLKAGAVCVPLHDSDAPDSSARLIRDSGARVVLGRLLADEGLPATAIKCVSPDEISGLKPEPASQKASRHPDALVAVLYARTSDENAGGVMICENAISARFASLQLRHDRLDRSDRLLWTASPASDLLLYQTLWPLAAGATVIAFQVVPERDEAATVRSACWREQVTSLYASPSLLERLLTIDGQQRQLSILRRVLARRDELPASVAASWVGQTGIPLHVTYGLPETSGVAAQSQCDRTERLERTALDGALHQTRLSVTDPAGNLPAPGLVGHLVVSGIGLARGYIARPDVTAERFPPDTTDPAPGARCFGYEPPGSPAGRRTSGTRQATRRTARPSRRRRGTAGR